MTAIERAAAIAAARRAAHHTLDLAREGQAVPRWAIVQALTETGDLPINRPHRLPGSWERGEGGLLRPATWIDVIA